jgi:UDP-N-acetylmuramate--alanine ligase
LQPVLAVVTNIDADHMETYGHDFGRLRQAFLDFVQRLPFYGMAVLCLDDANLRAILPLITKPVTTYGLSEQAQIRAVDIRHESGRMRFRAEIKANGNPAKALDVVLNLPGIHNVQNALAAIAIGLELQVPEDAIVRALAEFKGVGRRFQRYGDVDLAGGGRFALVDDYGHHPAEMAATIAAARGSFPGRRVVLAFQPHRYTRTLHLRDEFATAFNQTDVLVVMDIYPAGEAPIDGVSAADLAERIRAHGHRNVTYLGGDRAQLLDHLCDMTRPGDLVLTLGAGDVGQLGPQLLARLGTNPADGRTTC